MISFYNEVNHLQIRHLFTYLNTHQIHIIISIDYFSHNGASLNFSVFLFIYLFIYLFLSIFIYFIFLGFSDKESDPRDRYQLLEKIGEGEMQAFFLVIFLHTASISILALLFRIFSMIMLLLLRFFYF